MMHKKDAILPQNFCSAIGAEGEMVITDSSYYMDFNTALKLWELYYDESPLHCEIDGYGDFLQPLGPQASTDYIKGTVTQTSIRHKIYDILHGTPLHVAVMQHSKFYHIGTTDEYLDHICNKTSLAKEIGFLAYEPSNPDDDPSSAKSPDESKQKPVWTCVMNSICPKGSQIQDRCVVEYCDFKSPVKILCNSIVSSCSVGVASNGDLVTIPESTFLYTACKTNGKAKRQYVTVGFGIRDNMKKVVPAHSLGELSIFGKPFEAICGTTQNQVEGLLFPSETPRSLWHAKLFQPAPTMEEAFSSTMVLIETLVNVSQWQPSASDWEGRLSMADLILTKDILGMIDYRQKLIKKIENINKK